MWLLKQDFHIKGGLLLLLLSTWAVGRTTYLAYLAL